MSEKMNEKKNYGTAYGAARKAYEGSVGIRAVERAGYNPNIKGIIHEIMYADAQNACLDNLATGTKAALTKSTTAVRDDVVLMRGGVVAGRAQLKDTPKAISKTLDQVSCGKYRGTKLIGTKETTAAYTKVVENAAEKGKVITQKMTSSGISSTDTGRIASESIGKKAAESLTPKAVGKLAGSSGLVGAAISGGIEAVSAGIDLANGEIDGEEFVGRVAQETVGGGLSAAGGTAAASVAAAGAAAVLAGTAAPVWIPAAIAFGTAVTVGSVIKNIWDSIWD